MWVNFKENHSSQAVINSNWWSASVSGRQKGVVGTGAYGRTCAHIKEAPVLTPADVCQAGLQTQCCQIPIF